MDLLNGMGIIAGAAVSIAALVVSRRDRLVDSVNELSQRIARLEALFDAHIKAPEHGPN